MASRLRVLLCGLGRAGQFHLTNILSSRRAILAGVVDADAAKAQAAGAELDVPAFCDPAAALAACSCDAAVVATPTLTHHSVVLSALDAGKAVLSEKPLGVSLAEIDACYGRAARKGLPLFLAFQRRFDPTFASVIRRAREGTIGRLQIVRSISRDNPVPGLDYLKTSCGIFHDCVVHDLDMLCQITGEAPSSVCTIGHNFLPEIAAIGDLDTLLINLTFPSGTLGHIDVCRRAVYGYDQRVEVLGERGMLQAGNHLPTEEVHFDPSGVHRPPIEYSFPTRYRDAYRLEFEAFVACALDGAPVPVTPGDARLNFRLADAAEASYRAGAPVAIDAV